MLNSKFASDYTRYQDTDTPSMYTDNNYRQKEFYFSVTNEYVVNDKWKISLSGDYQFNKLDANLVNFAYPQRHTALIAAASALRLNRIKLQGSLLGTFVNDKVTFSTVAPSKTKYTPAIYATWQPFKIDDLTIRAFYKRIFRMPTFNDLYYTVIGNAFLNPEYATQYDLGFSYGKTWQRHILQQFIFQADGYYNAVTDKTVAVPTANPLIWMMLNLGKVKIKGVDISSQALFKLEQNLLVNTRLTYTFQDAHDYTDPSDPFYGHQIPYSPPNSISAIINADYTSWSVNYSFIYTGSRYDQKANIPKNYVEPWYTSDFSLAKAFTCSSSVIRDE